MAQPARYRGRFAPSPTGPLHQGSLVAAVASYLEARAAGGQWLVRMEDLDTPRCVPGAADLILRTLHVYGLHWDGPVLYQSSRLPAYQDALQQLIARNAAYPCGCSRKEIGDTYPGTCRNGLPPGRSPRSWRVRGAAEVDDFVLKRADGIFAYQLAVVVDDAFQDITHVVRGADLEDSTPRQLHLQSLLGLTHPAYRHVPVVTNENGEKLSKQTLAPALRLDQPQPALLDALRFLGVGCDQGWAAEPPAEILRLALRRATGSC
ncbi:MAG: tRNA glutamyl-Q(34) synthetase GluQRS [Bryobacterales bacterium]|nr:tRNA glutamyl-Q(34) synthetase GluQRS [Bryobacterales bacterium]